MKQKPCQNELTNHALPHLPLTVGHLHGLQFGMGSSVEAFHLLLLQPFKETDGVLVDAASLRQHQWSGSVVVTVKQGDRKTTVEEKQKTTQVVNFCQVKISPNINLQTIGDQELYGINMATQV